MADVTHSSTTQMSGSLLADHILDGSYGFTTSNATVKIASVDDNLFMDGQTIISDGTFVIGTNASKKVIFATDSTAVAQFTTDGALDLLAGKLLIDGNTGSANQVLRTDGYGNISWVDQPSQQFAFGSFIVSGQDTVTSSNLSQALNLVAGSGISITTDNSNSRITITASGGGASDAFKTIAAGGNNIVADSSSDTVTLVAGSNVTISSDPLSDTITISASTSGDANQNAFQNVAATGQNTIQAGSTTDTVTFDSENNTSMDARYAEDRDKVTLATDTSTNKMTMTNNIPKTFSMASKVPITVQNGQNQGIPLRNKFYNVTTSGVNNISGGGTSLGVSTRALELTNSSGTTSDVLMPAKSDNSTLMLSILDSSGTTHTIDMDVAE
tara:strand:- start:101 stop:1255 length:1155 start_codon:yes stop_codon:yes gene_type:complete